MWPAGSHVECFKGNILLVSICRDKVCLNNILNMNKIPELSSVFVNDGRKAS
jgi:hypothetical protein